MISWLQIQKMTKSFWSHIKNNQLNWNKTSLLWNVTFEQVLTKNQIHHPLITHSLITHTQLTPKHNTLAPANYDVVRDVILNMCWQQGTIFPNTPHSKISLNITMLHTHHNTKQYTTQHNTSLSKMI
jgi:hypothetical protein